MKSRSLISVCLVLLAARSISSAQLLVSEILSSKSPTSPAGANDYWELTNFGNSPVPLGGYKWDDDSHNPNDPSAVTIPAGTVLAAGESIIFTLATETAFRTWWSLPASVKIISSPSGPGFSENDGVSLFDTSGAQILFFRFGAGANSFTRSDGSASLGGHAGPSAGASTGFQALVWDPLSGSYSPRYTFAAVGSLGCFMATTGADVGSPGAIQGVTGSPGAGFSADLTNLTFGQAVTFTATAGNAPGATYIWNFGDGETDASTGAVVTHRYPQAGSFTVSLTVTAGGASASETKSGYISVTGFSQDSDSDGLPDGLEYFFAMDPTGGPEFENLPRMESGADGIEFLFTRLAYVPGVNAVFEYSEDLTSWSSANIGLDYDVTGSVFTGNRIDFTYGIAGTGPSPAGQSEDHLYPHREAVEGAALGGVRVVNHGMVGVGRISGNAVDQFGETLGGSSGLRITGWAYNKSAGRFTGTLNMLPDRGYNGANYAARIHHLGFTFTPYNGASPVAQGQVVPVYQDSHKFIYTDNPVTKFTTGMNPTNNTSLFGQTVGTVVAANGPGGSQQALLSLDAESLELLPDGSGFVSDEYGAYLARFNPNGRITGITQLPEAARPHSPVGTLNFSSNITPANGRRDNQGLEGISITPDGKRLFALLQSGLVQDNGSGASTRNNARLFVYNIEGGLIDAPQLIGEYVVKLPRYDANGNGSAISNTANQSEIVAIGSQQFLMLPEDGNGLGGAKDQGIYKCVQLVDFASATNILGQYDTEGASISPSGVLRNEIKAAASKDVINLLNPADHAKFGINTNNASPDSFTLQEKIEGMALVPDLSTDADDDYFLFIGNDNDFQSSQVKMLNPGGSVQSYGDNRVNGITNDAVFYVYRLTIGSPERRFYRLEVTGP